MKILLSAYACEPGRGSEPGVGWEWFSALSKRHTVHLITRQNNVAPTCSAIARTSSAAPEPTVAGLEPAQWILGLKRRHWIPVPAYYVLWQLTAAWGLRRRLAEYDLVHHVTFNSFRTPGAWWNGGTRIVLGPLGGSAVAPAWALPSFRSRFFSELLRTASVTLWFLNPWTRLSLHWADMVIVATGELRHRLARHGIASRVLLECAIPPALENHTSNFSGCDRRDFVWAGTIEPWKGWTLAWHGFARAFSGHSNPPRLKVFGEGREKKRAQRLASRLGIGALVQFHGRRSQTELWDALGRARGLLFPSVRDTSGNAILEAMACRCPVICFNHQGAAEMTDDGCAFRIEPRSMQAATVAIGEALRQLHADDSLVERMGSHGRERALRDFTWSAKVAAMEQIYQELQSAEE